MRGTVTACWPIPNTWSWVPGGLAEGRTYVAEEQGSLVGSATWAEAGGIAELEDLFVDPGWRRRGSLRRWSAASRRFCGRGGRSLWR
jgi:GNAT superfamily N-acetyltransferase